MSNTERTKKISKSMAFTSEIGGESREGSSTRLLARLPDEAADENSRVFEPRSIFRNARVLERPWERENSRAFESQSNLPEREDSRAPVVRRRSLPWPPPLVSLARVDKRMRREEGAKLKSILVALLVSKENY